MTMSMTSAQGPGPTANKLAMSKALGAAFLNHQVEQLEKSVNGTSRQENWRDRRYRGPPPERAGTNNRRPQNGGGQNVAAQRPPRKGSVAEYTGSNVFGEDRDRSRQEKDADVVVVDASVLVHALPAVKKWCRDGRQEVVIVPLEGAPPTASLRRLNYSLTQPSIRWIS